MENSIAYWVGVAESAARTIEMCANQWPYKDSLERAKVAHDEACENIMRILGQVAIYFPQRVKEYEDRGVPKGPQALIDFWKKLGYDVDAQDAE